MSQCGIAYLSPRQTVFINGRFLGQRVTGIQRYAREVLAELDSILAHGEGNGLRCRLLAPKGVDLPELRAIPAEQFGHFRGHLWEQLDLPWRVGRGFLFSFGATGPVLKRRQSITVHDTSVRRIPESFGWRFRLWHEVLLRSITRRSPLTITVSRFSAGEIAQCFGVAQDRLRIATEGWQHLSRIEEDDAVLDHYGLGIEPYALAVSSPTPNKNFATIAEAIRLLGDAAPPCVAAGMADPGVFRGTAAHPDAIKRVGYVSDAALKALYRGAGCFIFPSFYEGFGIPPLEAMACGCPVLASTAPAVREVCGDAALYFDPNRPDQLAGQIREVFADTGLRQRLSRAGLARAKCYSWKESARLNLAFMQEAVCKT
ncbi:glycosyltransferase family 4 protein [Methylomagnum ishizawai]|uniref:glycosyltransferase family 4 protein n=1 Tax=Methylomagnum ishizawai TaxID=1760988 RepID=UPI001C331EAC|nr:glycosyltransferase family 1 protein [Methylomagnum ishizawai]BBL72983.1 group 1 glycosyl transferase [Methylomagnum ishizawai]